MLTSTSPAQRWSSYQWRAASSAHHSMRIAADKIVCSEHSKAWADTDLQSLGRPCMCPWRHRALCTIPDFVRTLLKNLTKIRTALRMSGWGQYNQSAYGQQQGGQQQAYSAQGQQQVNTRAHNYSRSTVSVSTLTTGGREGGGGRATGLLVSLPAYKIAMPAIFRMDQSS